MGNAQQVQCARSPREERTRAIFDESTEKKDEGIGPILYNPICLQADGTFKLVVETEFTNLVEIFESAQKKFKNKPGVGYRKLIKVHKVEENGKFFEKFELENEYKWITYHIFVEMCWQLGAGFRHITKLPPQSPVLIFAETQYQWMQSFVGLASSNYKVVTSYATLGKDGVKFAINQTQCAVAVVDSKLLPILQSAASECPQLKFVFSIGEVPSKQKEELEAMGIIVTTLEEAAKIGKANPSEKVYAKSEDPAVIMYTSGTTSNPKGVVLTHSNLLNATIGCIEWLSAYDVVETDLYISFLPLAHILELVTSMTCFRLCLSIGYANPHTLTPSGIKLKVPESLGDAVVLKPTVAVFAPAVLDKVYSNVMRTVNNGSAISKWVFNQTLESGKSRLEQGGAGASWIWNKLVCEKIQQVLGGRVRAMAVGSAPTPQKTHEFMQTALACPLRQGYGLTETCAASCVQTPDDYSPNCVGGPFAGQCIRLATWEDGGYRITDKHNPEIGMPRGEVYIGGPCVALGYYVSAAMPDPEIITKNAEDYFTIDGIRWFKTGDVGQIKKDGSLQIIDRKKDLWKGPNGEYVSFGKVEAALKYSMLPDLTMVYGKTGGAYPVVLVCPNKDLTLKLAEGLGIEEKDFAKLCDNEQIVKAISKDLLTACKHGGLVAFEIPQKVGLISELWTPDNDMLTAAMKLKRPAIVKKHLADLDRLYA